MAKRFLSFPFVFVGFVNSSLTSAISVNEPPLVIAMNKKAYQKNRFRGIFAWFSVFSSFFVRVGFLMKGIIEMGSINLALFYLPILFLGSHLGAKFSSKVDPNKFRKIVIGINISTGSFIIISSLIK